MPITSEQTIGLKAPFDVVSDLAKKKTISTVEGFSNNDPLGVGGGLLPDMPTAYFKGGGWLIVSDLLKFYSLA